MCNAPSIRKTACSKVKCDDYSNEECPNCNDLEETLLPTLNKVKANISFNQKANSIRKIKELQNVITSGQNIDLSVIIINGNPPYVTDGNHRLMALATLLGYENYQIKCYIGA